MEDGNRNQNQYAHCEPEPCGISFTKIDIIKPKIKEKIRVPIHGIFNMFLTNSIEIFWKGFFIKILSKTKTIKEMVIKKFRNHKWWVTSKGMNEPILFKELIASIKEFIIPWSLRTNSKNYFVSPIFCLKSPLNNKNYFKSIIIFD